MAVHTGRFALEKDKPTPGPKNGKPGPFTVVAYPRNKGSVTITTKDGDFIVILDGVFTRNAKLDKPLDQFRFLAEEDGDEVCWFWSES